MKYDHYFATQYKECFVYFGTTIGTSAAETDDQVCTMGGCVATLVEVEKEDGYIWSSMPSLSLQLHKKGNLTGTVKLCGGYTCGNEIKLFATVNELKSNNYGNNYITKCWTTSLAKPSLQWTENIPPVTFPPHVKIPYNKSLTAVRKCKQYVIYFYTQRPDSFFSGFGSNAKGADWQSLSSFQSLVVVIDEKMKQSCLFSTDSLTYDGYISCAVVGADLFIASGDKMARVEKFGHLLVASAEQSTMFSLSFDLNVPHANSTLFVIQDSLCVAGGCDEEYDEPFSNIYQFDQETHKWSECGVSAMARYGASVVPFTDRNKKEVVIIAGGFKAKGVPSSKIEILSVAFRS